MDVYAGVTVAKAQFPLQILMSQELSYLINNNFKFEDEQDTVQKLFKHSQIQGFIPFPSKFGLIKIDWQPSR